VTFDLLVFDLDGTLVDSLPDITRALNLALADIGHSPLPPATVRTLVGEGVVRLAEKALAASAAPDQSAAAAAALAARVRTIYQADPCVETRLFSGMEATLRALQERGHKLAVLTNKPGDVTRPLLRALGIDPFFAAVIGDGDGHPRKPDPGAILALVRRFAVTPARTLMVGDGLPDMDVARAAACPAAAALWGYTPEAELLAKAPAHTLRAPADLLRLV
jgi:phosphoglycolate phosphatase